MPLKRVVPTPGGGFPVPPCCPYNAPMARKCSICENPTKNEWVARRHLEGYTPTRMEVMAKEQGHPMKRETIGKHLKECLGTSAKPEEVKAVAAKVAATIAPTPDQSDGDVAVLVQKQVVQKLNDGEARVTVQHGLQAQQLLDRRAERAKDRELAVTLARLLHSGAPPPEAIRARPVDVIEGNVVEVTSGD